jgi:hypothetical protein
MASIEKYQDLAQSLAKNVELMNTRSGSLGLQDAFKEGGQLNSILKLLDYKENQLIPIAINSIIVHNVIYCNWY